MRSSSTPLGLEKDSSARGEARIISAKTRLRQNRDWLKNIQIYIYLPTACIRADAAIHWKLNAHAVGPPATGYAYRTCVSNTYRSPQTVRGAHLCLKTPCCSTLLVGGVHARPNLRPLGDAEAPSPPHQGCVSPSSPGSECISRISGTTCRQYPIISRSTLRGSSWTYTR